MKIKILGDRPKHDLDKILNSFTIEEIVSEYTDLEPSGNDFIGLCPLHDDNNTKSLRVYSGNNSFYCFGCQKGQNWVKNLTSQNRPRKWFLRWGKLETRFMAF